jgi:hypothetical protein
MTINISHDAPHPGGFGNTRHKGMLENCPDPHCQDQVQESKNRWGTWCQHGTRIVEKDPDRTDCEGYSVGRIVEPWPCGEPDCTREIHEAGWAAEEEEYHAAMWDEYTSNTYGGLIPYSGSD